MYISTGWPPEPPSADRIASWERASRDLERKPRGRRFTRTAENYMCWLGFPLSEFAGDPDVPERMLERIKVDLPLFVASGLSA